MTDFAFNPGNVVAFPSKGTDNAGPPSIDQLKEGHSKALRYKENMRPMPYSTYNSYLERLDKK